MIWQMETQDVELKEDTSKTLIEVHRLIWKGYFRRGFFIMYSIFCGFMAEKSFIAPKSVSYWQTDSQWILLCLQFLFLEWIQHSDQSETYSRYRASDIISVYDWHMSILIASYYRRAVPCLNFQIKMREQIKRQSLVYDYRKVLKSFKIRELNPS